MGSSIGSLVTIGAGSPPDDVAPCAPLGKGGAACGALEPAGAVGVGAGGVGAAVWAEAPQAIRNVSEPAARRSWAWRMGPIEGKGIGAVARR